MWSYSANGSYIVYCGSTMRLISIVPERIKGCFSGYRPSQRRGRSRRPVETSSGFQSSVGSNMNTSGRRRRASSEPVLTWMKKVASTAVLSSAAEQNLFSNGLSLRVALCTSERTRQVNGLRPSYPFALRSATGFLASAVLRSRRHSTARSATAPTMTGRSVGCACIWHPPIPGAYGPFTTRAIRPRPTPTANCPPRPSLAGSAGEPDQLRLRFTFRALCFSIELPP